MARGCPKCKGCGAYDDLKCSHWGPCDCDAKTVECEMCDGTGGIPDEDDDESEDEDEDD